MRSSSIVVVVLVALSGFPQGLRSQVSTRVTVAQPAPGALTAVVPTTVATAPLPGLAEVNIPAGDQLYVRENQLFNNTGASPLPGSSFRRELRNGRLALVETKYELFYQTGIPLPNLKAVSELIHPGDSKLIYTGPWGGSLFKPSAYYIYLFRPLETPPVVTRPRAVTATFAELNTSTTSLSGRSVAPRVVASPSELLPSTAGCTVPTTLSEGGLANLVCLLLKDGQSITLPTGIKLFRRQLVTEVWSGDKLIDQSNGLVVRDGSGRHWLLEAKGYR
jgi:hypothetical protein